MVDRVGAGSLVLEGALGLTEFERGEIVGAVFAGTAHPGMPAGGVPAELALAGGSRLSANLIAVRDGALWVATAFADELRLPLVVVSDVVLRRPDTILLAQLEPLAADERPSIGGPEDLLFPWKRDVSVAGSVLALGGVERATGLGVHALSRLTFAVPEGASALAVTVGLCDEVMALPGVGSVSFELVLDGDVVARSGIVRRGDPPVSLHVDGLAGAERIELVTGDAGDHDAGDRAAWVDGVFLLEAGSRL